MAFYTNFSNTSAITKISDYLKNMVRFLPFLCLVFFFSSSFPALDSVFVLLYPFVLFLNFGGCMKSLGQVKIS